MITIVISSLDITHLGFYRVDDYPDVTLSPEEKNIYPSEDIIRWKDNILYIELEKWYMREGKRKEKNNKIYKSGGEHQQQEPSQALDDIVMSS